MVGIYTVGVVLLVLLVLWGVFALGRSYQDEIWLDAVAEAEAAKDLTARRLG